MISISIHCDNKGLWLVLHSAHILLYVYRMYPDVTVIISSCCWNSTCRTIKYTPSSNSKDIIHPAAAEL